MKRMAQRFGPAALLFFLPLVLAGWPNGLDRASAEARVAAPAAPSAAAAMATPAPSPAAKPEEVGLSSERLERITAAIERAVDDGRIAGGVALVARRGKIAYHRAVGLADRESKKPMRTDSLFRIASMTKPITSVAVMMLYEEGHFLLNQPVSDFLPEFKEMKVLDPAWPQDRTSPPGKLVPAARPITIRHLLTHTSGLTYHWNPRLARAYREANVPHGLLPYDGTIADGMKKLAALPLLFQPGDQWEYSLSDDVLGYLVEVVSGLPLDRFFEERIFKPLGMKDTHFYVPAEKMARLATAYTYYDGKGLEPIRDGQVVGEGEIQYSADYAYAAPRKLFAGGAGLSSTAEDYYRFCQMMLNGGELDGRRLLSRKSVELIRQDHVEGKLDAMGYGLGFGVASEPRHVTELGSVGAYWWGGFFYTSFVIDPKEELVAVFMGQLHPTGGLNLDTKVTRLAYQAIND